MRILHRRVAEERLEKLVLPDLIERVFHVTSLQAFDLIKGAGALRHNRDGTHPHTSRWSELSTFREWSCVSFCDLRHVDPPQLALALSRYRFLDPHPAVSDPVFMFLHPDKWSDLVTYAEAMRSTPVPRHLVPYVESGYPDQVALEHLEEVLFVTIDRRATRAE